MTSDIDRTLREEGFVGWQDAVDRSRIDRARRVIHEHIGRHGLDPARLLEFENASYCPELRDHPDILALFNGTRLQREAERRLGPLAPATWAQIALRFPNASASEPRPPHLDGVAAPHNGVAEGEIKTFSALACVYLNDVVADGGALTVWPGSHLSHAAYFREHGTESLLRGMPEVARPEARALTGRAGQGFLVHYLVAHAVGAHRAPSIRYAVFFRLRAEGHAERSRQTMTEPWLEWRLHAE